MAAGRHSVLIVPLKLANFTPLEPVEGSETSIHGTVFRKHDECIEIRQRVHETETDSSVGETVTRDGFHLARLSDGHRLVKGSVSTHA